MSTDSRHQLAERGGLVLAGKPARVALGQEQQTIDEDGQGGALLHDVQEQQLILLRGPRPVEHHLDGAADRRQWRTQFVGGVSDEVPVPVDVRGDAVEHAVDRFG